MLPSQEDQYLSSRNTEALLQPSLATEVPILLGMQPIRQAAGRQFHIVVGEYRVLCDIACELTTL
jgi:hypothetical protein